MNTHPRPPAFFRFSISACLLVGCLAPLAHSKPPEKTTQDPRQIAIRNKTADETIRITDEAAFFALLDLKRPELAAVREAAARRDWKAAKTAWASHLEKRVGPRWVWSYQDREKIKRFLGEHGAKLTESAAQADKVMRREFDILGVPRKLERDIVWESVDYEYEWCNVLNRHEYWRTLGLAWWQTGDPKYVDDWVTMLRDWLADNPPGKGQPWRSLEVGIRASGWFDIMSTFMDAPAFDASLKYEMTRSLVEHARFLHKHNTRFKKGNWQTTECMGLASVGIMLPEFIEAPAWRDRAFGKMGEHMRDGVYPDGAQYELTPGYHTWVMMQFLHVQRLAKKNGYQIRGLTERHEKMFEFLMHISTPDQRVMSHGDGGGSDGRSIKSQMGLGALLYSRPDMRHLADDKVSGDWIWLFSPDELAAYAKLPSAPPKFLSHMMPDAQYGVMRTGWKKNDRWLFFDCAPWGGAHSHADQLQILLYSGRDLIIDAGQISYDQPLAKTYFKSAQAHNILLVDEQGQDRETNPEMVGWCVKDRLEFASGRMKQNGVAQQRSVLFVKPDYWVVVDHVSGKGSPTLTRLFHLPKVDVKPGPHTVQTGFKDGDNLWIDGMEGAALEMREAPAAKGKTPRNSPVAAFVTKHPLPTALCTVLVPFRDPKDIPKVEQIPGEGSDALAIRVTFQDGRTDWIAVAPGERELKAGAHNGKGVALWASKNSSGTTVEVIHLSPITPEGARRTRKANLISSTRNRARKACRPRENPPGFSGSLSR